MRYPGAAANSNPNPNPNRDPNSNSNQTHPNGIQARYTRHRTRVVAARRAKAQCLLARIVPLLRLRTRVRLKANAAGIIAQQLLSVAKLGVACIAVRAYCYRMRMLMLILQTQTP